jgi:hypothetical protein
VLQLLAVTGLLFCLFVTVVPLGLAVVLGPQASWDLSAIDERVLVTVTAVATWRLTWVSMSMVRQLAVVLQPLPLVL